MDNRQPDISEVSLCTPIRVARLDARKPLEFDLQPDAAVRMQIARMLGLDGLRKFRFHGKLRPLGRQDWELKACLGATIVQPCAVTLDPVVTRIDEAVQRRFLAGMPEPEGLEVEMPEDDSAEPLGNAIDISTLALEALALALPAFPRADGAELPEDGTLQQAPPGETPVENTRANPFAALAGLKHKLDGTSSE